MNYRDETAVWSTSCSLVASSGAAPSLFLAILNAYRIWSRRSSSATFDTSMSVADPVFGAGIDAEGPRNMAKFRI
ncbi:hypothetical protein ACH35V_29825 [Actinomadura sp. 1N219]|uniref:hypothetical protein n=1 Tax=Actinomadura sp. 1N219 TaxID=3375152 RepID=UPI0037B7059A